MPKEVVHHRNFHRERGRGEIIKVQHAFQEKQHTKLHKNSNRAHQIKLAPAHQRCDARQICPEFSLFFAAFVQAGSAPAAGSEWLVRKQIRRARGGSLQVTASAGITGICPHKSMSIERVFVRPMQRNSFPHSCLPGCCTACALRHSAQRIGSARGSADLHPDLRHARAHRVILSSRYSRTVFSIVNATSISPIPARPIAPPTSNRRYSPPKR